MINIDSQYEFSDNALLERAARFALDHQSAPANAELTIVLADDAQLRELNREYLGIDSPTDVLSFPSSEIDPETDAPYLGDIILSIPRATQQAQAAGHRMEEEAQLLVVHGTLHLLGHDHAEPADKTRMWQAQAEIMVKLGLSHVRVVEE
ncbi:MAG: rRNA maturation RNase YbeY [Anaerolineales bacterium]|nr:rRNA maturation RNase YbeY [Anaerolineales bacterium]